MSWKRATVLAPRFDANGLITCVAVDAATNEILMLAHMNAEALSLTMATGEAHYYSRSRKALWKKGETSGHTQKVSEIRIDCDQDAVIIKVTMGGTGAACHTAGAPASTAPSPSALPPRRTRSSPSPATSRASIPRPSTASTSTEGAATQAACLRH